MIDNVRVYSRCLSEAEVAAAAGFVATNPMGNTWVASGTAVADLIYDAPGDKVMSIQYQNSAAPFMGEASAVPAMTDMTKGPGNLLIWVRGSQANGADPIYAALQDSNGVSAVVAHSDPLAAQDGNWAAWIIPLNKFAGVNLASVAKLTIGVGNGQPGGAGAIRIDDITLVRSLVIKAPADVTIPGDFLRGVPNDGDWPAAEYPALAIDNNVNTKFLHYKGDIGPSGIQVAPITGATIVTGLTLTTANDTPARDPVAFELYGSNVGINGPYELIAAGQIVDFNQPIEWPRYTKNTTPITFANTVAYDHYQLIFTAIRNAPSTNSMQIAEVELIGISASAAPKGLAGWWKLDGNADDSSTTGANGTVIGGPLWVAGKIDGAVELDGVDDFVDCGNPTALDFGTDFAVCAWIKMTSIVKGTVFGKGGDESGGIRYALAMGETDSNKMCLTTDDDKSKKQAKGATVVNDGAWHHVVGMRNGNTAMVYVDGKLDGTVALPEGYSLSGTSQHDALIGAVADHRDPTGATKEKFFAGTIDDVRVYNRALLEAEIRELVGL
jgi:hypothetical protein